MLVVNSGVRGLLDTPVAAVELSLMQGILPKVIRLRREISIIISFGRLIEIDTIYVADIFTVVHVRSCKCLQQFWKTAQRIKRGKTQLRVSVD